MYMYFHYKLNTSPSLWFFPNLNNLINTLSPHKLNLLPNSTYSLPLLLLFLFNLHELFFATAPTDPTKHLRLQPLEQKQVPRFLRAALLQHFVAEGSSPECGR